ncbi:hypothetical protein Acsp02_56260 [Actinoplanes sp. NBRC 103695]|nr:hypothetical protein Acsp02_56260 [Actinoplanes sp. NBRC 103695]
MRAGLGDDVDDRRERGRCASAWPAAVAGRRVPDDDEIPIRGLHWKTKRLTEWAGERTFIWLDDEISDTDRRWVQTHHQGSALLHRVDPLRGLTDADFTGILHWLAIR